MGESIVSEREIITSLSSYRVTRVRRDLCFHHFMAKLHHVPEGGEEVYCGKEKTDPTAQILCTPWENVHAAS